MEIPLDNTKKLVRLFERIRSRKLIQVQPPVGYSREDTWRAIAPDAVVNLQRPKRKRRTDGADAPTGAGAQVRG